MFSGPIGLFCYLMIIIITTSPASLIACDSLLLLITPSVNVTFYVPSSPAVCVCVCVVCGAWWERDAELQRRGEHVMWEWINKRIPSFTFHFAASLFTAAVIASFPTNPGKQWGKITARLSLLHSLQFHNILLSSRFTIYKAHPPLSSLLSPLSLGFSLTLSLYINRTASFVHLDLLLILGPHCLKVSVAQSGLIIFSVSLHLSLCVCAWLISCLIVQNTYYHLKL